MKGELEKLVQAAVAGDKSALEEVATRLQERLYNLCVRMLGNPDDAEDALQEIMIKIITKLSTFRGESLFTTWAFRVASNHLLTMRRNMAEQRGYSFESFEEMVESREIPSSNTNLPELTLLVEEMRISCLHFVLLCLDRESRLAYILGEIMEVSSREGAWIMEVANDVYRKKLSRARMRVRNFMMNNCGLVNNNNRCKCEEQAALLLQSGRDDSPGPVYTKKRRRGGSSHTDIMAELKEMDELTRVGVLFRSNPAYKTSNSFADEIKRIIKLNHYKLFQEEV